MGGTATEGGWNNGTAAGWLFSGFTKGEVTETVIPAEAGGDDSAEENSWLLLPVLACDNDCESPVVLLFNCPIFKLLLNFDAKVL